LKNIEELDVLLKNGMEGFSPTPPDVWSQIAQQVQPVPNPGAQSIWQSVQQASVWVKSAVFLGVTAVVSTVVVLQLPSEKGNSIAPNQVVLQAQPAEIIAPSAETSVAANTDLVQAEKMGIVCENAGEANADAVGEHTLGMLLMLLHKLSSAHAEVKARLWQREANRGIELKGKTVGIIGFGNTGKAVAEKLQGFGVKLLVYDKYKKGFGLNQIQEVSLQMIQAEADIISFHVPLTKETNGFLDASFIAACQKQFFVLNLSRGKVVNHEDLINGLNQGKVLGAALDVLENEKIATLAGAELERFNTLANAPNVIITPHIGGWTQESYLKISQVLLDKFLYFSGNMK
jgi:D-3-phosphoglycerate dehydrogenase